MTRCDHCGKLVPRADTMRSKATGRRFCKDVTNCDMRAKRAKLRQERLARQT